MDSMGFCVRFASSLFPTSTYRIICWCGAEYKTLSAVSEANIWRWWATACCINFLLYLSMSCCFCHHWNLKRWSERRKKKKTKQNLQIKTRNYFIRQKWTDNAVLEPWILWINIFAKWKWKAKGTEKERLKSCCQFTLSILIMFLKFLNATEKEKSKIVLSVCSNHTIMISVHNVMHKCVSRPQKWEKKK